MLCISILISKSYQCMIDPKFCQESEFWKILSVRNFYGSDYVNIRASQKCFVGISPWMQRMVNMVWMGLRGAQNKEQLRHMSIHYHPPRPFPTSKFPHITGYPKNRISTEYQHFVDNTKRWPYFRTPRVAARVAHPWSLSYPIMSRFHMISFVH